jgi:hypothetical protein
MLVCVIKKICSAVLRYINFGNSIQLEDGIWGLGPCVSDTVSSFHSFMVL